MAHAGAAPSKATARSHAAIHPRPPSALIRRSTGVQAIGRRPQEKQDVSPLHYECHRPEQTTLYRLVQLHAAAPTYGTISRYDPFYQSDPVPSLCSKL